MNNKLKEYVYPNGVYSHIRANSKNVKKYFPEVYEKIKDNYATNLYMLCNNITKIPKCLNPNCNNEVKLKNIGGGFRHYCSKKCISEHQKIDKSFSKKISKTHLNKSILRKKYSDLNISVDKNNRNYYIIKNYCHHSDIRIYSSTFLKLYNNNINLCQKCKNEIIENYIPTQEDIFKFQKQFNTFYLKYRYLFNEKWFKRFYPKEYKMIILWSSHLENVSLSEAIYLFKHNLKNRPKCSICNKNFSSFNHSTLSYTITCKSSSCLKNSSKGELELYNFLKIISLNVNHKFFLNKNEFDIFFPDKNIAIEFNGLYWHGEKVQRNKNYHYNKWELCQDNRIKLITIWEDDWYNKQDLIKSMLRNQLGLNKNKIYARKTEIKEVNFKDAKEFLENNHIQGYAQSSVRLGLYYNNELVSLMTFGKRNIGKKTQFELLRFCNIKNTSIVGGASKLFHFFIKNYNPEEIISYANLDISNGNLYEILGFKNLGHTGVNYWWVKDKIKFHRSKFMKHKLVAEGADPKKTENEIMREKGFYKLYGLGNLKYVWNYFN